MEIINITKNDNNNNADQSDKRIPVARRSKDMYEYLLKLKEGGRTEAEAIQSFLYLFKTSLSTCLPKEPVNPSFISLTYHVSRLTE